MSTAAATTHPSFSLPASPTDITSLLVRLPQLSPVAAKVYLTLFLHLTPDCHVVIAPIASLCALAAISPRTCREALRQLRQLALIRRLPRQYQQPNSYLLIADAPPQIPPSAPAHHSTQPTAPDSPANGQPIAAFFGSNRQSIAPYAPANRQPAASYSQSNRQSVAPLSSNNPSGDAKNPMRQPAASLLNQNQNSLPSNSNPASLEADQLAFIDAFDDVANVLHGRTPPDQCLEILARSQAALARLQTRHPIPTAASP